MQHHGWVSNHYAEQKDTQTPKIETIYFMPPFKWHSGISKTNLLWNNIFQSAASEDVNC